MRKVFFMTMLLATSVSQAKEPCPIFPISHESVKAGSSITWNHEKTALLGIDGIEVGKRFPASRLTTTKMSLEEVSFTGKVRLISILPSLDTPICDATTHQIEDASQLGPSIERVTISMDLPYAQRRFADSNQLKNITFLSDYRTGEMGRNTGLMIDRNGLLARALIVTDKNGIVRYLQIVPEITDMPDLKKAYAAANEIAHGNQK
jgi:thiol peroxidase